MTKMTTAEKVHKMREGFMQLYDEVETGKFLPNTNRKPQILKALEEAICLGEGSLARLYDILMKN